MFCQHDFCSLCCSSLRPSRDIQIAQFNFRFLCPTAAPRLFCGLVMRHRDYTNSTLRRARFQLPPSLPLHISSSSVRPPLSIGVQLEFRAFRRRRNSDPKQRSCERMHANRYSMDDSNYRYRARFTVALHDQQHKKTPLHRVRHVECDGHALAVEA